jgi:hypothetical protein
MNTEKNVESKGLADYVGFSAPEIPKYLILNNFLSCYFNFRKADKTISYSFDDFKNIITCEENDKDKLDKLKRSFNKFFSQYTGESMMSKGKKSIYLPINENMIIIDESTPLRNLPHRLMKKSRYSGDLKHDLTNYLYNDSLGTNQILSFLCSTLEKTENTKKRDENETDEEKEKYFRSLAVKMGEDIKIVLTNKNFIYFDYYRKIEYLSTLLAFYALLYIIKRPTRGNKSPVIICKGSANTNITSNEFHRACLVNYVKVREGFNVLFKDYFTNCLKEIETIIISNRKGKIIVNNDGTKILFSDFIKNNELGLPYESINTNFKLLKAFSLTNDGDSKGYSRNDFILRYINFLKNSSGSSFSKISSALPTLGREAGLVFPLSSTKYKYFALSEDLAEFFIRLYLSSKESDYDYLDSFVDWLQERYDIYIVKSGKLEKYLKLINAKISVKDFNENEDEFIKSLINVNCLIKMSDNGYVITLPEKKGEFKLL